MADIGQRGGTATVTASTTPTGHTIQLTSNAGWLKVYQNNQAIAIASADTNTDADDRTAILTAVTTTTPSSEYSPTSVSDTRTFPVTQAGTGSTPTPTVKTLNIKWITGTISNSLSHAVSSINISNAIICGDDGQQTGLYTNGSISSNYSGPLYVNNETNYSIVITEANDWWEGGADIIPGEDWTLGIDISRNQSGTDVIVTMGWNSWNWGNTQTPNIYQYVSDGQTLYFIPHVML